MHNKQLYGEYVTRNNRSCKWCYRHWVKIICIYFIALTTFAVISVLILKFAILASKQPNITIITLQSSKIYNKLKIIIKRQWSCCEFIIWRLCIIENASISINNVMSSRKYKLIFTLYHELFRTTNLRVVTALKIKKICTHD